MLQTLTLSFAECELKFSKDGAGFTAYAAVFNGSDTHGDTILKGAFAEDLARLSRPLGLLYEHKTLIGKWTALAEDDRGLFGTAELTPGHSIAQDVYALMKHGALDGTSIGFRVPQGGATQKSTGGRVLSKINLDHIAVVRSPSDREARIMEVKSRIEEASSLRDVEEFLRDSGYSKSTALTLLSRIKTLVLSDSALGGDEITEIKARLLTLAQKPESMLEHLT